MVDSYLETDPAVVSQSGQNTAGTAGDWSGWATQAATAFQDAAGAVCNTHLSTAVGEHSTTWNPVVQQIPTRVSNLGSQVTGAAVVVDGSDADGAHLLATMTGAAQDQSSTLNRTVNV